MKTNTKSKARVYVEGDRVIKDFGSRISDAEKTLSCLNTFRKHAGTVKINSYSVMAASAEIHQEKPGCVVMPRYDGVMLSELGDDDFKLAITIVSSWYAHQFNKTKEQGPGFIHGDPILQNIIMDKKRKQVVFIDAVCREATPKNIWLDVLLLTVSISYRLGISRTRAMQQILYNDIIKDNHALESRRLLIRQFLLFSKFFLLADDRIRERAKAISVLFISAMNFMRLLNTSPRKSPGKRKESAVKRT